VSNQTSSTAITTSTASKLSRPKSSVKEAVGLIYENSVNCADTRESGRTFSGLTFSKVFTTSSTRVSICDLSRELAAEKAARCGIRLMCSLESEEEATWREVTLRKARRRNDMRDSLHCERVNRLTHCASAPCRSISFSAGAVPNVARDRKAPKNNCIVCVTVAVTKLTVVVLLITTRAIFGEPQPFNSPPSS